MAAFPLLRYHLLGLGAWRFAGLDTAFFNLNGFVSIAYCLFTCLGLALRSGR